MAKRFEILEQTTAYQGFLRLERLLLRHESFRGGWCEPIVREQIAGLGAASVLPYDPVRDEVVLIEEFRTGALDDPQSPWLLEVVSGYREPGESHEAVIRREAMEEAGITLGEVERVGGFYVSPGISTERIELFCAQVDSGSAGGIHGVAEEGEEIRVVVMPASDAIAEIFRRIDSTGPIILMQWFAANRQRLRRQWGGLEDDG
jgi:ADP-ribose pyrophosphatase